MSLCFSEKCDRNNLKNSSKSKEKDSRSEEKDESRSKSKKEKIKNKSKTNESDDDESKSKEKKDHMSKSKEKDRNKSKSVESDNDKSKSNEKDKNKSKSKENDDKEEENSRQRLHDNDVKNRSQHDLLSFLKVQIFDDANLSFDYFYSKEKNGDKDLLSFVRKQLLSGNLLLLIFFVAINLKIMFQAKIMKTASAHYTDAPIGRFGANGACAARHVVAVQRSANGSASTTPTTVRPTA